jgi:hypothetical protein
MRKGTEIRVFTISLLIFALLCTVFYEDLLFQQISKKPPIYVQLEKRIANTSVISNDSTYCTGHLIVPQNVTNSSLEAGPQRNYTQSLGGNYCIAICFFGQVKHFDHVFHSVKRHVFDVLDAHRVCYETFAHTYDQPTFTNARNNEHSEPLDPRSLQRLLALPDARALYDPPEAADRRFDLARLSRYGDPWPDNPAVSLTNFVRQLHSLGRVGRLWAASGRACALALFLRPDVLFLSDLDLPALAPRLLVAPGGAAVAAPFFHKFGGVNDRLAFGPPAAMRAYAARGDHLQVRSNTGQILVKYWSNTGQIPVKYWSNTGQILVKYWSNTDRGDRLQAYRRSRRRQ